LFIPSGTFHTVKNVGSGKADRSEQERKADIGFLEINEDITLRRMVVHNPRPKGRSSSCMGFQRPCTPGKTFL
jgi:hypothetical protein